jgi:divalent metal cation (Fe/Co/Zn/Cd) transporter
MLLGILGFFVFMATIQTVVLEVRGEPAGFAAAILAVLVLLTWWVWRARRNTGV